MMKNQKKTKVIRRFQGITNYIIVGISLVALFLGCYAVWDNYSVTEDASPHIYDEYKPKLDRSSFKRLQKKNKDVFGWISVYGTKIDYPLVQGKDNQEYLEKDPFGESRTSGSIYLDYRNNKSFLDFNSIIYGHHMEDGMMFGDIERFQDKDFFNEHKYGNLYYDGREHGIEFSDFLVVDAYDNIIYHPAVIRERQKQQLLNRVKKKAKYTRNINVSTADHLVFLSTCDTDLTNGRYVLVGRVTDHVYKNPFATNNKPTGIDKAKKLLGLIPFWMWALLLFIILLLFPVVRRGEKEEEEP